MQWLQDDKIKHRVIGFAVLLSIALVILPAMVKKSNQRLDESMNLTLHLPAKPPFPDVAAVKPQVLFKTVKVAHVVLPDVVEPKKVATIERAKSLSGQTMADRSLIQKLPVMAKRTVTPEIKPAQRIASAVSKPLQRQVPSIKTVKPVAQARVSKPLVAKQSKVAMAVPVSKGDVFSVQIASFTQQANALTLVQALQKKGFKATYDKQGDRFRVLVGPLGQREKAKQLRTQLASATQLTGFIVKEG